MDASPATYVLPNDLHQVIYLEGISVSPTDEPKGQGAEFYAFAFPGHQELYANAFGSTPSNAVAKVLEQLGKSYYLIEAEGVSGNDAAVAAIAFALATDEGLTFLRLWNEGEFETLRSEWPEAPEDVYIGADPLYVRGARCEAAGLSRA